MISETSWSEDEVRKLIASQPGRYQNIKLPYGLETGGDDRSATCNAIFPADLTGKSVLDIGSLTGYFCFEALRRGARSALGIEIMPERIRQAQNLAGCLGLHPEFRLADFEKDPVAGQFDYVICLNVLHHLKNPLAALEKLVSLTREKLVLEVASIGLHDRRKLDLSPLRALLLSKSPILYVAPLEGKSGQKFFLTPEATHNLLMSHRKLFASLQILPSEHKNRFIAVASKRRVKHLLVVAGPTSSGKSTLINRLLAGELPALAQSLELGDLNSWRTVSASQLPALKEPFVERLVFHYDFIRALFKSSKTCDRDEILDVLDCAEQVDFVTVHAAPDVLRTQLDRSEIQPKTVNGVFRGNKRHLKIRDLYHNAADVQRHYQNWFDYTRTKPGRHTVVSLQDGLKMSSLDQWETALAAGR